MEEGEMSKKTFLHFRTKGSEGFLEYMLSFFSHQSVGLCRCYFVLRNGKSSGMTDNTISASRMTTEVEVS